MQPVISKGTGFYPSYFSSPFLFLLSRLSHWSGVSYTCRDAKAAGTVSLNRLSSTGVLESRSLSDTHSKCIISTGSHCQPLGLLQELCCFLKLEYSAISFRKILLHALTFRLQEYWVSPALPVEDL